MKLPFVKYVASLIECGLIVAVAWSFDANFLGGAALADHPPVPNFTHGDKRGDLHDWNLGPTGARGWMWGSELSTDKARQILITKVDKGSPADGVLKEGDIILGLNDKPFQRDARIALGTAITNAERTERHGQLHLLRWRNGKTETVLLKAESDGGL